VSWRDRFEAVIGLEVHVELQTRTKMFCGCEVRFGAPPNSLVCPVCLGLPGSLPVPNRRAVEFAVRAALALGCEIAPFTKFDRKNYHYPDLPKNYQISQYDRPIGKGGGLEVDGRLIRLRRLHLEEDTGKSLHEGRGPFSLLDFNRAGVPLLEIVSEPDLREPEEARKFLQELRLVMLYTGVSDCRMEEGSLRCDANISLRPRGSQDLGVLVEIKNMNSFRSVERALEYEAERQAAILSSGGRVVRETRHWDEERELTFPSRSKEEAHDYRYFPDPDLVPIELRPEWIEEIRRELGELPSSLRARYRGWELGPQEIESLVEDPPSARFLDQAVKLGAPPREAAHWLLTELRGLLREKGMTLGETRLSPAHLVELLSLLREGAVSGPAAKRILALSCQTGIAPREAVQKEGLEQISDRENLREVALQVIRENEKAVGDYRRGKTQALTFLVGQMMRLTRGKANPSLAGAVLEEMLKGEKGDGGTGEKG
jgi:aspartyl-tRNA(Asn)/glutamyl-tRNA(Gln) amidotransferase subunit B